MLEFKYNEGVGGRLDLLNGDCVEVMRGLPDSSIDAVITDPPYGLSKEPDMAEVLRHWMAEDLRRHALVGIAEVFPNLDAAMRGQLADRLYPPVDYTHRGGGFMGKRWDSFVPGPSVWREVMRVLKPGGHVLAFYGTRTYDLGVLAMRLAGFEIRDQLAWMYGSGFPKAKNAGRAVDMLRCTLPGRHYESTLPKANKRRDGDHLCPEHPDGDPHRGKATALKPAQEPIVLARKPLAGTVARNVLAHGTGGINVDGCRIEASGRPLIESKSEASVSTFGNGLNGSRAAGTTDLGRWPANVLLDEAAAAMLDEQTGSLGKSQSGARPGGKRGPGFGHSKAPDGPVGYGDSGGASRFFYVAKAGKREREAGLEGLPLRSGGELTDREDGSDGLNSPRAGAGRGGGRRNCHPTVKPIALMRYLCRLITPPGGTVLDPFMGSGSTGCAALMEGFGFVGIEMQGDYMEIAQRRIEHWRHRA